MRGVLKFFSVLKNLYAVSIRVYGFMRFKFLNTYLMNLIICLKDSLLTRLLQ